MGKKGKVLLILNRAYVLDAISAIRYVNSKPLKLKKKNLYSVLKRRKPMDKPDGMMKKWNIEIPN
jgi:hypothetical protein